MNVPFIDLKTQYKAIKDQVDQNIHKVLEHGAYVNGPEITEFEGTLAKFTGAPHAIACASGTDALVMALMALNIGPGDEVITTNFSFIASAESIVTVGATPVFVDIDPETYNLNPEYLEKALTEKTKAIIPVSLYGQPADMDEINTFAEKNNLSVIEDAAQSFGATYKNKKSCNLSKLSCTSFFPAKPLGAYGDAGAVFTQDDELNEKLRQIRVHGDKSRYEHVRVGLTGRMDTMQAAILLAKMERFPWEVEQRQHWANRYKEELKDLDEGGHLMLPTVRDDRDSVWAQFTIQVADRSGFQSKMKELGVPTSIHYPTPMPYQEGYKNIGTHHDRGHAERAAQRVVSLPMFPDMSEDVLKTVTQAVRQVLTS